MKKVDTDKARGKLGFGGFCHAMTAGRKSVPTACSGVARYLNDDGYALCAVHAKQPARRVMINKRAQPHEQEA